MLLLLGLVLFLTGGNVDASIDSMVVDCPFGKIRGVRKTDENTGVSYLSFKGIPYAKPPVGELRFAKPQPHPKLGTAFDATKDDVAVCPHPDTLTFGLTNFTEDCLVLNIQTKDSPHTNLLSKVIVYIHGGSFIFGTGAIHDSKSFVIRQDVIVVTINYRLGILGFLSLENEASPGNYGLWDQALAIKWVKDNIREFGGDPDDITIAGESAGGASVGYQTISPYGKGLFTKAYPMSGMASSSFAQSINIQSTALMFARSVGCWERDIRPKINLYESSDVIKCLRDLPLAKISSFVSFESSKTQFVPCVDGDFVPDAPIKLFKDKEYLESVGFFNRAYLISIVNNEIGLVENLNELTKTEIFASSHLTQEEKESSFQKFLTDCEELQIRSRLKETNETEYSMIKDLVVSFYEKRTLNEEDIVNELLTDLDSGIIPTLDFLTAASQSKSTNSYFLYLNHYPRFVTGPSKGTPHEADLAFWFELDLDYVEALVNAGIRPELFDEDDEEVKLMFSSIIGEFARSGNPGLALKDALLNGWPKYDVTTSHFLNFNLNPWVGSFLYKDVQDFWLKTVPNFIKSAEKSSTDIVVDCPFGKIRGVKKSQEKTGVSYLSFKGIPYAKPPVGDLRFAKPQPHPKLDGVFDASKDDKIICPHPKLMKYNESRFQEDCLILNILTKDINPSNPLKKVLVFIHGGGFRVGSSSFYDSKSFVISQDVIVVTINYRLGVLGFLSTENEASPGNYGLWDQTIAIKWVKDNIRAFGGDPDDIAIAGESAGGVSVAYQSLSPHTKGLFTKVYPHSGTSTSVFGRSLSARFDALNIAKLAGCWDGDVSSKIDLKESKTIIDCLRKAPVSIFAEFNDFLISKTSFVPVVDGDFIPDIPAKLLKDDDYLDSVGFFDRSYLVGVNNNEGTILDTFMTVTKYMMFADNRTSVEQKELTLKQFFTDIKALFMKSRLGEAGASDENLVSKIDDFYNMRFYGETALKEMMADLTFLIPSLDHTVTTSRRSSCNSYLLYFDYFPHFMKGKYRGTAHGVDLSFWFDAELELVEMVLQAGIEGHYAEEDVQLKQSFSSVLGDFIKTGNPGLSLKKSLPSAWPKYDATNGYYLRFNSNPSIDRFLAKEKHDLWFGTVSNMMQSPNINIHSEL